VFFLKSTFFRLVLFYLNPPTPKKAIMPAYRQIAVALANKTAAEHSVAPPAWQAEMFNF